MDGSGECTGHGDCRGTGDRSELDQDLGKLKFEVPESIEGQEGQAKGERCEEEGVSVKSQSRVTTSLTDLMSWAKHTVSAAKDRSRKLVERVHKSDNNIEYCKT